MVKRLDEYIAQVKTRSESSRQYSLARIYVDLAMSIDYLSEFILDLHKKNDNAEKIESFRRSHKEFASRLEMLLQFTEKEKIIVLASVSSDQREKLDHARSAIISLLHVSNSVRIDLQEWFSAADVAVKKILEAIESISDEAVPPISAEMNKIVRKVADYSRGVSSASKFL